MVDEPLTDAGLAELEALLEVASPAPWIAEYGRAIGGPDFIMITDWDDAQPDMYVQHDDRPAPVADLRLIAAARNSLPRLISEIRHHRATESTRP